DEGVDALRDHTLNIGDGLLRIALAVGVTERRDARALLRLSFSRGRSYKPPTVAAEAVGQTERNLLRAAPGRCRRRLRRRRRHHAQRDGRREQGENRKGAPFVTGHISRPPFLLGGSCPVLDLLVAN